MCEDGTQYKHTTSHEHTLLILVGQTLIVALHTRPSDDNVLI